MITINLCKGISTKQFSSHLRSRERHIWKPGGNISKYAQILENYLGDRFVKQDANWLVQDAFKEAEILVKDKEQRNL